MRIEYRETHNTSLVEEHWDAEMFLEFSRKEQEFKVVQYTTGTTLGHRTFMSGFLPASPEAMKGWLTYAMMEGIQRANNLSVVLIVTLPEGV